MTWDDADIEMLRRLHAEGVRYPLIAERIGVTRSAICGAVRRHVYGVVDPRSPEDRARYRATKPAKRRGRKNNYKVWTDRALTETWAERKARRAREKTA